VPTILEVDISKIAIISGITNMVKAIILVNSKQYSSKLIVLPNTQILGIGSTPYFKGPDEF
jgi:hypothetical protein